MDGAKLRRQVLDFLDESDTSPTYADTREIYEYLDWAAAIFVRETGCLHATVTITTVEDQQAYALPPSFLGLYVKDALDRFIVKYSDGDATRWPHLVLFEEIWRRNETDSRWPTQVAVRETPESPDTETGTATADGAASGGECVLTDAAADFTDTDVVYPRSIIHNTDDGSTGVVLEVTGAASLRTALFGGTANEWTSGDAYVIEAANPFQLYLDAPADEDGHTIEVPYVTMPTPVYSDYGVWRLPLRSCRAICAGAASLFQIPKREYADSAQIGGPFAAEISRIKRERGRMALRSGRGRRRITPIGG